MAQRPGSGMSREQHAAAGPEEPAVREPSVREPSHPVALGPPFAPGPLSTRSTAPPAGRKADEYRHRITPRRLHPYRRRPDLGSVRAGTRDTGGTHRPRRQFDLLAGLAPHQGPGSSPLQHDRLTD